MKKILLLAIVLMPFTSLCQVVGKTIQIENCKALACPYCGKQPVTRTCINPEENQECWTADCQNWKTKCPQITTTWSQSEKASLDVWNFRVAVLISDDQKLKEVKESGRFGEKIVRLKTD